MIVKCSYWLLQNVLLFIIALLCMNKYNIAHLCSYVLTYAAQDWKLSRDENNISFKIAFKFFVVTKLELAMYYKFSPQNMISVEHIPHDYSPLNFVRVPANTPHLQHANKLWYHCYAFYSSFKEC